MKTCATCDNYEKRDGTCRGDLPKMLGRVENNYPHGGNARGRWPTVERTEWCAMHKPIPPATRVVIGEVKVVD